MTLVIALLLIGLVLAVVSATGRPPLWAAVFVLIVATFCIAAIVTASEPAEPSGMTKTVTCELRGWDVPPQFC